MAKKKILTLGFVLYGEDSEYSDFETEISLLDWDIILIKPEINDYIFGSSQEYRGKPCLSNNASFKLKSKIEHWKREIQLCLEHSKTVIVFLDKLKEVYIDTGERRYSGTGKNRQTTELVELYNNYHILPINIKITNSIGKEIKLAPKNSEIISQYWTDFGIESLYQVIVEGEITPCLQTKHGDKTVGFIVNNEDSNGRLIGLPNINFSDSSFYVANSDDWSEEAKKLLIVNC